MVRELGIEGIKLGGGMIVVEAKVKTENGIMGIGVSLELRKEPGISEAVTALENAIEAAMVANLGLGTPVAPVDESAGEIAQ